MCHCKPNVRTPCCGPQCCGLPGGCGFCTGSKTTSRAIAMRVADHVVRVEAVPQPDTMAIDGYVHVEHEDQARSPFRIRFTLEQADRISEAMARAVREARRRGLT